MTFLFNFRLLSKFVALLNFSLPLPSSPLPSLPLFHRSLYEPHAFLLDQERSSMLPVMARGLDSILFSIPVDASYLNSLQRAVEVPVVAPQTMPTQNTILDRLPPASEDGGRGLCVYGYCGPVGPPTYAFTHTCMHARTHARTHARMHTHTHTHTSQLLWTTV